MVEVGKDDGVKTVKTTQYIDDQETKNNKRKKITEKNNGKK